MSLKAFHVFFIAVCLALSVGVSLWGLHDYGLTAEPASLAVGLGAVVAFFGLAAYGAWFLRKLRRVSFI